MARVPGHRRERLHRFARRRLAGGRGHEVTVFDRSPSGRRPRTSAAGGSSVNGDFLNVGRRAARARGPGGRLALPVDDRPRRPPRATRPSTSGPTSPRASQLFAACADSRRRAGVLRLERRRDLRRPGPAGVRRGRRDRCRCRRTRSASRRSRATCATSGARTAWSRRRFRISNPYGPRQNPLKRQGVIPIFLRRVAEGHAGDGLRRRLDGARLPLRRTTCAEMIAEVGHRRTRSTICTTSAAVSGRRSPSWSGRSARSPAGRCRWNTCRARRPSSTTSCWASRGSRRSSPPGRRPRSRRRPA